MGSTEKKKYRGRVSVINWMLTLIVSAIPGVNLIAMILFLLFAKTQSKRNYAIATLLLAFILLILVFVVFLLFPDWISSMTEELRTIKIDFPA